MCFFLNLNLLRAYNKRMTMMTRECLACVSATKSRLVAGTSLTVASIQNVVGQSAPLVRSRATAATVRSPKIPSCVSTTCSGAEFPTSYAKVTHTVNILSVFVTFVTGKRLCINLFVGWVSVCLLITVIDYSTRALRRAHTSAKANPDLNFGSGLIPKFNVDFLLHRYMCWN